MTRRVLTGGGHAWSIYCYFCAEAPTREQAARPPDRLQDPEAAIAYLYNYIRRLGVQVDAYEHALERPLVINVGENASEVTA